MFDPLTPKWRDLGLTVHDPNRTFKADAAIALRFIDV
jgi:hypothetical protein